MNFLSNLEPWVSNAFDTGSSKVLFTNCDEVVMVTMEKVDKDCIEDMQFDALFFKNDKGE